MSSPTEGTALITGATAGLGAAYAELLADRGHDIILVARDKARLDAAAAKISSATGRSVSVLSADLSTAEGIRAVEARLADDASIDTLVNNAGGALFAPLQATDPDVLESLVTLNVTSVTRIAAAAAKAFANRDNGTIINIASALALNIMPIGAAYSGTKAYVLAFTQGLAQEFADSNVTIQVVLPGGLRTAFWNGSGIELDQLPAESVMEPSVAAEAALAGLEAGELVTIPSLRDYTAWETFEASRLALIPTLSLATPADRYTT
ncbi:SDR family NAD(P)-dependent oxidoreductase [Streptomyces sp. NPDC005917]|uniref:SDR family NAD(P)-dependent oxidoreductase n=1 Tax=unclassified Streptomyces TaxID=2593676 RepID=UPI00340932B9